MRKLFERRVWLDQTRGKMGKLTDGQKKKALKMLASEPLQSYLIALMDEMIRHGIYKTEEENKSARFFVDTLTQKILKGREISTKELEEKKAKKVTKTKKKD